MSSGTTLSYQLHLLLQYIQIFQGTKIDRLFLTTDGIVLKHSYIATGKRIKIIRGSKYKALFTYYNKIPEKFVRYFLIYVAFCIRAPLPGPLQREHSRQAKSLKG